MKYGNNSKLPVVVKTVVFGMFISECKFRVFIWTWKLRRSLCNL